MRMLFLPNNSSQPAIASSMIFLPGALALKAGEVTTLPIETSGLYLKSNSATPLILSP